MVTSGLESLFAHMTDTVASLIESIKEGRQLEEDDFKAHMGLYGELKAAYVMACRSGEADNFDQRPHLKGIIAYLSRKFWSKFEKKVTNDKRGLHFSDLLDMIMRWMQVLKVTDVTPVPLVQTALRPEIASNTRRGDSYASISAPSPLEAQPTECCDVYDSFHWTRFCPTLGSLQF